MLHGNMSFSRLYDGITDNIIRFDTGWYSVCFMIAEHLLRKLPATTTLANDVKIPFIIDKNDDCCHYYTRCGVEPRELL